MSCIPLRKFNKLWMQFLVPHFFNPLRYQINGVDCYTYAWVQILNSCTCFVNHLTAVILCKHVSKLLAFLVILLPYRFACLTNSEENWIQIMNSFLLHHFSFERLDFVQGSMPWNRNTTTKTQYETGYLVSTLNVNFHKANNIYRHHINIQKWISKIETWQRIY